MASTIGDGLTGGARLWTRARVFPDAPRRIAGGCQGGVFGHQCSALSIFEQGRFSMTIDPLRPRFR
jgi:hypothetical protein